MLEPRFRWVLRPLPPPDPRLPGMAQRLGISERLIGLLAARGVTEPDDLERFFGPAAAALHDPALLPDAGAFLDRIEQARLNGERIMVFGDFDADGLTGLAILTLALRRHGLAVETYVPRRLEDGHGLSAAAVEAAAASACALIVTVDCGTTSVREVGLARERGIDVIVTDHHRVPDVLPDAVAIVNAHRPDSHYPDRRLTGSGVAFKLAFLVLAGDEDGPEAALALADLATIGTVADVAPILGENRAIARLGLELLRTAPRPAVAALLAGAGISPASVDLETIGFAIAPRLNAAGRMGEALDAARLLLATDAAEAAALAAGLESVNLARRDATKLVLGEARLRIESDGGDAEAPAIVVRGPWPVGIVGLIAGRLAEESGRPAVVGAELGDVIRASCRSDGGLDLAAALGACADLLVRFGGHSGAAGFEISAGRWDEFRDRFLELAKAAPPAKASGATRRRSLELDLALDARAVDYSLLRELASLEPHGPGQPQPLVSIGGLRVVRSREAAGGHSQLTLRRDPDVLDAIAFGWPELAGLVTEGEVIDVVARIVSRRFGGLESLQLEIRDAAPSGYAELSTASVGGSGAADQAPAVLVAEPAALPST